MLYKYPTCRTGQIGFCAINLCLYSELLIDPCYYQGPVSTKSKLKLVYIIHNLSCSATVCLQFIASTGRLYTNLQINNYQPKPLTILELHRWIYRNFFLTEITYCYRYFNCKLLSFSSLWFSVSLFIGSVPTFLFFC